MANSDPLSFEEKLRTAVKMPQPRQEFLAGLRDRLGVEITRPLSLGERLGLIFRRPTMRQRVGAVAGMVALLLVATCSCRPAARVRCRARLTRLHSRRGDRRQQRTHPCPG